MKKMHDNDQDLSSPDDAMKAVPSLSNHTWEAMPQMSRCVSFNDLPTNRRHLNVTGQNDYTHFSNVPRDTIMRISSFFLPRNIRHIISQYKSKPH
jgi:hypothetical protein